MTRRALIEHYFDAINNERWADLGALFTASGTYTTMGLPPCHGREQVIGCFTSLFRAWETHLDTPHDFIVDGDRAAVKVVFTGRSTRGHDIAFDAVDVFAFEGDSIAELTTWYDRQALNQMLRTPQG
jgi:ketosteroid isomerase-like protein